jgi:hypothetical protein
VTDIFREVEEDVRRERIEKLWKEYGDYVLIGVAVVVLAVAGWQFWSYYHTQQLLKASDAYSKATLEAQSGNTAAAAAEFARLSKEAPGGYATLAKLQQANVLMSGGNVADAVTIYRQIEQGSDPSLAAIARIRHAWAIVDFSSQAEIVALVGPLTAANNDWKYSAREIIAYSDYRAGKVQAAIAAFKALADHPAAPPALRQRALAMMTFLSGGAGRNVGTVPEPLAPPKPADAPNNGTPTP